MANLPFPSDLPFSLHEMRNEFDRLLDRVWHGGLNTAPLDGQDWAPRIDVVEHPDAYHLRVELPGVRGEDVDVSILNNEITIKGVKHLPDEPPESVRRLRSECRYGCFNRKFEFASEVRPDDISATCKAGVLHVKVPKALETKGHKVPVQSVEE